MDLSPYALVSLAELKTYAVATGTAAEDRLKLAINSATAKIEAQLGRPIVTRGEITEYHSPRWNHASDRRDRLRVRQWPIISVETIHEDMLREYGAPSLLVVDEDYLVSKPTGLLLRVLNGSPKDWFRGARVVKVVYTGGYDVAHGTPVAGARAIPDDLKAAAMKLAAMLYHEADRKAWGQSAAADELGNVTHTPGTLSRTDWAEILGHADYNFAPTYEHDEWEQPA